MWKDYLSNTKNNILKDQKNTPIQTLFCCILIGILVVIYGCKFYTAISFPFLQEYRETTMVVFAEEFSKGRNPYALSSLSASVPSITSVYGFLCALICAPFVAVFRVFDISALIVCRVIVLIMEILGLVFAAKTVKVITRNETAALSSALLISACYWRYRPFGGAYPDQLGILINFLLMYLVIRDEHNIMHSDAETAQYHPLLYALLLVLAFYVKQYFVFSVLGLLVYMLVRSKKDLIRLIISGALITILSLIIVQLCFPLYLSEALPISQGSTASYGFLYSLEQIPFIIRQYYLVPVGMCVIAVIGYIVVHFIKRNECNPKAIWGSYIFLEIICSFPLVLLIARNNGTYMTYWLQIWFVYLIIGIVIVLNYTLTNICSHFTPNVALNSGFVNAVLLVVVLLFTYQSRSLVFEPVHTSEEYTMWNDAYEIMDEYGADGNILADAHMSLYLYNRGISTSEYGQCEYSGADSYSNVVSHPLWSHFPYAIQILENNIAHEKSVKEKLAKKEYSLVVLGNIYRYYISDEELLECGYKQIKSMDMPIGNITVETSFWVPSR